MADTTTQEIQSYEVLGLEGLSYAWKNKIKPEIDAVDTKASGAVNTANEAKGIAEAAQGTASEAKTSAEEAKTQASEAKSLATGANTTASEAKTIASNVNENLQTNYYTKTEVEDLIPESLDTSNFATKSELGLVEEKANNAAQTASNASIDAGAANTKANEAKSLAEGVKTKLGDIPEDKTVATYVEEKTAQVVTDIVAGADKSFDTLKEIADFLLTDVSGAGGLIQDVADLQTKVDNLAGGSGVAVEIDLAEYGITAENGDSAQLILTEEQYLELKGIVTNDAVKFKTYFRGLPTTLIPTFAKIDMSEQNASEYMVFNALIEKETYTVLILKQGGIPDNTYYLITGVTTFATTSDLNSKISTPEAGEVGQALVVKAVDADGKPTEFETKIIDVETPVIDLVSYGFDSAEGLEGQYVNITKEKYEELKNIISTKPVKIAFTLEDEAGGLEAIPTLNIYSLSYGTASYDYNFLSSFIWGESIWIVALMRQIDTSNATENYILASFVDDLIVSSDLTLKTFNLTDYGVTGLEVDGGRKSFTLTESQMSSIKSALNSSSSGDVKFTLSALYNGVDTSFTIIPTITKMGDYFFCNVGVEDINEDKSKEFSISLVFNTAGTTMWTDIYSIAASIPEIDLTEYLGTASEVALTAAQTTEFIELAASGPVKFLYEDSVLIPAFLQENNTYMWIIFFGTVLAYVALEKNTNGTGILARGTFQMASQEEVNGKAPMVHTHIFDDIKMDNEDNATYTLTQVMEDLGAYIEGIVNRVTANEGNIATNIKSIDALNTSLNNIKIVRSEEIIAKFNS